MIPGFKRSWGAWARLWAANLIRAEGMDMLVRAARPAPERRKGRKALEALAASLVREAARLERLAERRAQG